MKKFFILLVVTHSFQGFLLAQENLSTYSTRTEDLKDNAMDDFDIMFDDADAAMGDITPTVAPQKNSINYLALAAYFFKNGIKFTVENIKKFLKLS